jgi:hypothetical protein
MNKKQAFFEFLEALKGHDQDALIESVKEGFKICFESTMADTAEEEIANYVVKKMPENIKTLRRLAMWSLYYGSIEGHEGEEQWPGWSKAVDIIRSWVNDNIYDLWYDVESGEVLEKEPEGYKDEETEEWIEPVYEDYIQHDSRIIKNLVFGELAEYV